jgi:hypothetical protein
MINSVLNGDVDLLAAAEIHTPSRRLGDTYVGGSEGKPLRGEFVKIRNRPEAGSI